MGSRSQVLRFGPFEFDKAEGELRKHGVRIFLEDHPGRVLELLLAEPGSLCGGAQTQALPGGITPSQAAEITMHAPLRPSNSFFKPLIILSALFLAASLSLPAPPQEQTSSSAPSITELKTRAESGNSFAQHYLFNFLSQGDSAAPGYDMALDWLRSIASHSQPDALYILGYLYEHGHGVPRDYAKAAENYQAAALKGNHLAQNNLASLYQHGLGVPKNLGKAIDLYIAAAQPTNPIAQCNLASMYFIGEGTPRNLPEAARWFRAAADLGYPAAQHNLAVFYFKGLGVPVDYNEALHWERLAAQQGYGNAETGLGYLYEIGKSVSLDYVAAYAWYSRAIAHGDSSASDRRKSLSHVMTRKQLDEANTLVPELVMH